MLMTTDSKSRFGLIRVFAALLAAPAVAFTDEECKAWGTGKTNQK